MPKINQDAPQLIDNYIHNAPDFAQPICNRLREIIHKASPDIKEDWKWGPNYNFDGMVCGFGAFKSHVSFVFFKGGLLKDPQNILLHGKGNQHNRSVKFTSSDEIDDVILTLYIKEAVELNRRGHKPKASDKNVVIPEDLMLHLKKSKAALANFQKYAYTYRKEYVQWVEEAKREETRKKRIEQVVERSLENKKLHEKYMK